MSRYPAFPTVGDFPSDGTSAVPLPEQSYIGDPPPPPSMPSWVVPVAVPGLVVPAAGVEKVQKVEVEVHGLKSEDYAKELQGIVAVLDRVADEMVKLRVQLAKLTARKRKPKK